MNIVVIGSASQEAEVRAKFGEAHDYFRTEHLTAPRPMSAVFDFTGKAALPDGDYTAFIDATFQALPESSAPSRFGFCGLPTFLHRPVLEVSVPNGSDESLLKTTCEKLGTPYQVVASQAGLVTPRVIAMIINEAYGTEEEGTANRADIDLAMKLGTNYPWGPFEWGKRIGESQIVKLLDTLFRATGDDRYKVNESLRKASA